MSSLRALLHDPHFRRGSRDMLDFAPGIAAWGLVTGVAMAKSGLSLPLAVLMSLTVYAGSAQLASLPLLAAGAPMWVIWAAAFCVNLRFVIFSAQWRPYWVGKPWRERAALSYFTADLGYVLFMRRYPKPQPAPGQAPYVWGGVVANWGSWQTFSIIGIVAGEHIPTEWGLAFAGTLGLLGLTCSLLDNRATWAAAAVAGSAAVAAYALPLKLNIVVAIAAAVAFGLLLDHRTVREAVPADDRT